MLLAVNPQIPFKWHIQSKFKYTKIFFDRVLVIGTKEKKTPTFNNSPASLTKFLTHKRPVKPQPRSKTLALLIAKTQSSSIPAGGSLVGPPAGFAIIICIENQYIRHNHNFCKAQGKLISVTLRHGKKPF